MKKIGVLVVSVLLVCLSFTGCGGGSSKSSTTSQSSNSNPTLVSITISGTAASVASGSTLQLKAQGSYSDNSTSDVTSQATWTTSDATMATVNGSGLLNATKAGSVTVTATVNSVSGAKTITITQAALKSIAVSGPSASLAAGSTEQLTAQGTYTDDSTQTITTQAIWQSTDPAVASVNSLGVLTALKSGTVVVTANIGAVSGTMSITVTNVVLTSITVTGKASIAGGLTEQLTAQGTYSDNSTQNLTSQVTWQSSNTANATVSAAGVLTAVNAGSSTITATMGSISGTMTVTVTSATLTSITITPPSFTVAIGQTTQLDAQGLYSDNSTHDITSQVVWGSSATGVANVSAGGLAIGVSAGTATITATMGSVSATSAATVTAPALSSICVTAPSSNVASGATEQLTAQGTYSDNSTQNLTSQVSWQSSNTSVATVSGTGLFTAFKAGTVVITATMGSVSGTAALTVTGPSLSSITITPAVFSIASGQGQQLSAQGVYSDGTTQNITSQVTWTSSASGTASVSGGLVTGVSSGTATITASMGSVSRTATVTVTAATLNSITVAPATASIATGQTQAFLANGVFSDGSTTDITNSVSWTSNATNFATINKSTGVTTGVAAGSATITATSGTASGTASLTVTPAVLTEIDISPDGEIIPVGGQYQLTLTGTYSDGSTQPITSGATWSSSDSTLASVDPNTGIVTGVANSNNNAVTITATYGGQTDTTTVYVTAAVPESLQITPATTSIASGTTQQYSVNEVYSDGSIQPVTAGLSWISSPASVASISTTGVATGIATGQATITVAYGSLTATAALTVTPATLTSVVVTPATTGIGVNGNVQFTATGVFSDNSTQDLTSQATWSSSVASYAIINSSGIATGLAPGTTTITASFGGYSGSATLTVSIATLVSINITPSNPVVPPHSRIQMTAIGVFSDGSQEVLSNVIWRSSNSRYATIWFNGVLRTRRVSPNPITISASYDGITGSTSVTISTMTIQSLQITPANPTIAAGTILPFQLIGTFSDGVTTVDLTPSARWQASNWRVAVIDRSGIAYGRSAGSVTIIGSYENVTPATTTLTVSNATVQSITVAPATPTIALGTIQLFTATALFSDGSTKDITTVAHWTSSTPIVAIVFPAGLAFGITDGQTNITATDEGVSGNTLLTVN